MEKNVNIYNEMRAAAFQRAADHGEPVAVFVVDNVLCDSLAACEDPRKGIRPQMQGVFVDLSAGLAACCDGYALNVSRLVDAQVFNADALDIAPVASSDSIQGAESTAAAVLRALGQSLTLAAVYGAQRTAAALKAAHRATIAARAWLRASHDFYAQGGDAIRCTGWQFVGYNLAAAVVAVLLSIQY